jgi:acyl-CoA reductase-like NAD-dependent aldehyde dehydrogenase
VARRAAERLMPVSLELGGKDPMIVLADADLERAANACVWGALMNSGQVCTSIERVYVEDPVYDQFTAKVAEKVDRVRQGSGSEEVDIGSMASPAQLEKVKSQVADAIAHGARVLRGGRLRPDSTGLFYEPTILIDVTHDMAVMREETFGPVIPIMRVKNWEEALRLANDSPYGLDSAVFTRDSKLGQSLARGLQTGSVCVNECLVNFAILDAPMGGRKQSGWGRRHGAEGIRKYCHQKTIVTDRFGTKGEFNWFPLSRRKLIMIQRMMRLFYHTGFGRFRRG